MKSIIFTYNWNRKLENKAFTTVRLRNDSRFILYETFEIYLVEKEIKTFKGIARIEDKRNFKLSQVNSFISFLDTGYPADQFCTLVKTMYKATVKDWEKQQLSLLLLVKET